MSTEFSFKDYSLSPVDLIPADDDLDDEDFTERDAAWAEYTELVRTVPTDDLMLAVSEAFSTSDVLRRLIDDLKRTPFTPGERRHLHVSDGIALGDVLAALIDQTMDDAVGMRAAGRAA